MGRKLCEHGYSERSEATGQCLICHRISSAKYTEKNKHTTVFIEKRRAYKLSAASKAARNVYMKKWRAENKEHVRAYEKEYKAARPEKVKEWSHNTYIRSDKDERNRKERARRRRRPSGILAAESKRNKAKRLHRYPAWANKKKIDRIYQLAAWASRFTDEPLEVDHIIPLQGKMISGLHVESNLQILTRSENRAKLNRWP